MATQEPTVFNDRYELHRQIARGGMADVYLARDLLLDRPVAVKVLFDQFSKDQQFVERFRREAQRAANLNHPNIVSVFDWGEERGTYFIVMEYVEGRSLAEMIRTEGSIHPDKVAEISSEVAAALSFAHRNGIVHRDVKPGNVLVSPNGHVKVADFGIARALANVQSELTQAGTVMGTATYISPEQAQGMEIDPRSDLYSLGVMIYEMLSGRPPFTGETPVAVAYQHVQDSPVSPRAMGVSVAESLEAVTMKLLAKNPVNRYPTAEDLRNDLRRYQQGAHDLKPSSPVGATGRKLQHPVSVSKSPKQERVRRDDGFRRTALFTVFMGILLVVFGYLVVQFLDTIGVEDDGDTSIELSMSEVPNLIGTPIEQAREILSEAKLSVQMDYQTNIDYPENTVFDQDPTAGAKLEQAETVRLWVSKGTGPMTLIKVIGDSVSEAVRDLEAMGLRVDTVEFEDPVQPAGQVIDQNPVAGSEITPGTRVILFVSKGPAVEQIPDLENRPFLAAMNIISQLGWLASTSEEASETIPAGLVIRTEPPAQSKLSPGSRVEIVISSGLPMILVPSVTSLLEDSALQTLEGEGFQVNLIEELLPEGSVNDGRVISQSPEPELEVELGTIVTIVIGRSELTQPDSAIDQTQ
ncbi:MAG: Stk1 family PASTA domain-containing Ser/Thr kinase [Actinomycetota bacterium]|nr:Stk1 family PASTA domain-containing Ser/Thr kinase [Acidimicrobiales bacterium]MEC7900132.1 Stk1 family PASTA domain-containing Ser/Thr kinase [Actinomycetota bacterium]